MSRYYKCDLCGAPYSPQKYTHVTAYIETGYKSFSGSVSDVVTRDMCPVCKRKLLDFMATLAPKEEENASCNCSN